jgi:hypothetical protein
MGSTDQSLRAWWKESSVYQVYPASYQDSTGSGVGDLKGIISRVDYLKDLGVDIVWLSPIFKSPQVDMVCYHLFFPFEKAAILHCILTNLRGMILATITQSTLHMVMSQMLMSSRTSSTNEA